MLKRIASIVNIRIWYKRKHWKIRKLVGRGCINYYRNGSGGRLTFVRTNKDGSHVTFDCPLEAMHRLMNIIKKNQEINYHSNKSWKLKIWDKELIQ